MDFKELASAAVNYVRRNPDVLVDAAKNAAGLRFGVPLAALRYLVAQVTDRKMPKDIELGTSPPALRLSATVDAMGTNLRASAAIKIDEISISSDSIRVGVRLNEVKLALLVESDSPIATLVQSGALDLSKPGNLVKFIPKRPPAIIEAEGDRIVVDLMKLPSLSRNRRLRRMLSILTPLVGIRAIETDNDNLYVTLRATPRGLMQAIEAIRS